MPSMVDVYSKAATDVQFQHKSKSCSVISQLDSYRQRENAGFERQTKYKYRGKNTRSEKKAVGALNGISVIFTVVPFGLSFSNSYSCISSATTAVP